MSAQQFLDNAIGKVGEILFGADYDDVITKPRKPSSKPNPYSAKPNKGNFSGQSRNVVDTIKDKIKAMPGSQPAKPNPYAAKPTGQLTQKNAGSLLGLGSMTVTGAVTAPLVLGGSEDAGIKWRRLGYSSKAAYDTAVKNNASGGKTNNASDINKRLDQQKAERAAALARTKGGYDHSSGSYVGQTSDRQILPADETRDVPGSGGGKQTGKNLGGGGTPINMNRTFDDLLAGVGQTPFGGTQLPTAMGNPYTATYKQTAGFGEDVPDIGGMNGATYDSEGGRNAVSATNLQDMAPFNPGAPLIEGGSERIAQQATGITSGRLSDALEGVKTQEANREMTPERRQLMARAAFMNDGDSMSGLRAKEAVNNVVYAGGQHYVPGESADSPAVAINRDNARDISNGKAKAQDFLAKKTADTVAAVKQSPSVLEDGAKNGAFQQDKPMFSGNTPAIEGAVEFDNNNSQTLPTFGAPKGYKRQGTKIDTSMTNPFGQ